MMAPAPTIRNESSLDLLRAWETDRDDPPISEAEAIELAQLVEADRITTDVDAVKGAAVLCAAYAPKLAKWERSAVNHWMSMVKRLLKEHHPCVVSELLQGDDRITRYEKWPPDEATLDAALTRGRVRLFAVVNRARLALGVHIAKAHPQIFNDRKFQHYRATKNGDAAMKRVAEMRVAETAK